DDAGLAHGLAVADRQRDILVGLVGEGAGHEQLARHLLHRAEHARILDPGAAQLAEQPQLARRRSSGALRHGKTFRSSSSAGTCVRSRKTGVTETAPEATAAMSVPGWFGASSRIGPIQ